MQKSPLPLSEFRKLLEEAGFSPSKHRGQNFLHDPNLCAAIAESAGITSKDHVVEVGTGCGYLTSALSERAAKVWALEIDPRLSQIAQKALEERKNIEFVVGDALSGKELNPEWVKPLRAFSPFLFVANLPYSIASPLLISLSQFEPAIEKMTACVQREVAERAVAKAGDSERGALGVLLQLQYRAEILRIIPTEVFWPRPKIDSAVLSLTRIEALGTKSEIAKAAKLVSLLFAQRRKQIQSTLRPILGKNTSEILQSCRVNPMSRAQELETRDFLKIAEFIPLDQQDLGVIVT